MEQQEDQKSVGDADRESATDAPTMDLLFLGEMRDCASPGIEDEEDVLEQNLIFPERPITVARMSAGLELALTIGLAYRFGLDPTCRDLYLWPAAPTTTDPRFWHARGSHIHILFDRNANGDFLPERAIMTLRHVDDIATLQPVDGRPLGGAFHFDIEPTVEHARRGTGNRFAEAHWFWTNRRDGAGAAWGALGERDTAAYLRDWEGLLDALEEVGGVWGGEESGT
ncbi:hypothetical protein MMC11_003380 [Xylographa trunciseda]|nr:hypothetical protein [Xylographa trunciseda]